MKTVYDLIKELDSRFLSVQIVKEGKLPTAHLRKLRSLFRLNSPEVLQEILIHKLIGKSKKIEEIKDHGEMALSDKTAKEKASNTMTELLKSKVNLIQAAVREKASTEHLKNLQKNA